MRVKKNSFDKLKYFDLKKEVLKHKNKFRHEKFDDLLKNAIMIRQRSDKKINFHLSGGIDSTALLIITKDNWSSKYNLDTSSFSYSGYKEDEYKFISRISKKVGVENHKITLYLMKFLNWLKNFSIIKMNHMGISIDSRV